MRRAHAVADIAKNGPALIGMITALAFLAALRSGAQGGPLALEAPDVAYVMLSPVDRMPRPAATGHPASPQRGLAGRRRSVPSSVSWPADDFPARPSPGLPAARRSASRPRCCGRARRWSPTPSGCRCGSPRRSASPASPGRARRWRGTSPARRTPPAAWRCGAGVSTRSTSLCPLVAVVVLFVGISMLQQTSLDALARRSSLVAQLRFAVTMQDLRTVILLRRQLNQEQTAGQAVDQGAALDHATRSRAAASPASLAFPRPDWCA